MFLLNDGEWIQRWAEAVGAVTCTRRKPSGHRLPNFCPIAPKWGDVWLGFVGQDNEEP